MLEILGLSKRYDSTIALDDCSFSVRPGRVLGFLGRNGAGKTTAMRSIFGLVQLDSGAIKWQGKPVNRDVRFRFGYMPEERGLYPQMTVEDQLTYFARLRRLDQEEAKHECRAWMERLDLSDRRDSPVDKLSHGNQQKVQLAVSLVGNPDLLVLDEPFSGLDPIAVGVLSEVVRERAAQGGAVVFSSHQLHLVEGVCDDIAVITRGHVVLEGDLLEVRRTAPSRTVELRLEQPHAGDWTARLSARLKSSEVHERNDGYARLSVPTTMQPEEVLSAVRALDEEVSEFRLQPPDLEEIFRRAAGEEP